MKGGRERREGGRQAGREEHGGREGGNEVGRESMEYEVMEKGTE